jgi:Kef-type K+ transport system membrane component KefB
LAGVRVDGPPRAGFLLPHPLRQGDDMEDIWFTSAVWIGLALIASLVSIRLAISVALIEIVVGAIAGNIIQLTANEWVSYLAALGSVLLTFLAGAEIDPAVIRRNIASTVGIGIVSFLAPYLCVFIYAHVVLGWPWPQAQIAGIAMSTTSVAVVYSVMIETGYNRTKLGKIILAGCFITDVGTVLALGLVFATYNVWLAIFGAATAVALWVLPRFAPWFFARIGNRMSEPETKFVLFVLFVLGGLAAMAKSEAVLPAYLVGMVLAPFFLADKVLATRIRVTAFTLFTPFYFLKAGSLVKFDTIVAAAGLICVFLVVKVAAKFAIYPLARRYRFAPREAMYTTLLMSTGLTFGSISALFGFTNGIIDQDQYTVLVTAVIASAVVPTLIAQRWFQPDLKSPEAIKD